MLICLIQPTIISSINQRGTNNYALKDGECTDSSTFLATVEGRLESFKIFEFINIHKPKCWTAAKFFNQIISYFINCKLQKNKNNHINSHGQQRKGICC